MLSCSLNSHTSKCCRTILNRLSKYSRSSIWVLWSLKATILTFTFRPLSRTRQLESVFTSTEHPIVRLFEYTGNNVDIYLRILKQNILPIPKLPANHYNTRNPSNDLYPHTQQIYYDPKPLLPHSHESLHQQRQQPLLPQRPAQHAHTLANPPSQPRLFRSSTNTNTTSSPTHRHPRRPPLHPRLPSSRLPPPPALAPQAKTLYAHRALARRRSP